MSPFIIKKSNLSKALATVIPSLGEGRENNSEEFRPKIYYRPPQKGLEKELEKTTLATTMTLVIGQDQLRCCRHAKHLLPLPCIQCHISIFWCAWLLLAVDYGMFGAFSASSGGGLLFFGGEGDLPSDRVDIKRDSLGFWSGSRWT
ncbi:hypothetical protein TNCV_1360001 [Trichonephila clavipes]|nr:hypothetical protein TNCV_1360001 [Trichonephila clavipes]